MAPKSALVVDDSKSARFALRRYLENRHYRVDAVSSAEEAFSFLAQHRPGVIFLDHVMPGTDGFEALRAIKADAQLADIPVVICSSHEGSEFNAHARQAGARDVLQKPPDPLSLTRILEDLQSRHTDPGPVLAATEETDQWSFDLQAISVTAVAAPEPPRAETVFVDADEPALEASPPIQARSEPEPEPQDEVIPELVQDSGLQQRIGLVLQSAAAPVMEQIANLRKAVLELGARQMQAFERPQNSSPALADPSESLSRLEQRLEQWQQEWSVQRTQFTAQLQAALDAHSARLEEKLEVATLRVVEESQRAAERAAGAVLARTLENLGRALTDAAERRPGQ